MNTTRSENSSTTRRSYLVRAGAVVLGGGFSGCQFPTGLWDETAETATELPTVSGETTVKWATDVNLLKQSARFQQALRDAGLRPEIEVEMVPAALVSDTRRNQFGRWLSERRPEPALLMTDFAWTLPFAVRDQLVNLSEALPNEFVEMVEREYEDDALVTATVDGDLYAVPLFIDLPVVLYRKDLVEAAGFDPDGDGWKTEPLTYRQFADVVATTKAQAGLEHGYTFQAATFEGLSGGTFHELLTSLGGAYFGGAEHLYGPVGDRPITVDDDRFVRALRLGLTFLYGDESQYAIDDVPGPISPTAVLGWTDLPSMTSFLQGEAVAHRNWTFAIAETAAAASVEGTFGVMPLPRGVSPSETSMDETGGSIGTFGGWNMAINPYAPAEKRRAAAEVIQVMATESYKLAQFRIRGWLPPDEGQFGDAASQASEAPVIGSHLDTLQFARERSRPRPITRSWPEESNAISWAIRRVWSRSDAPRNAAQRLDSELRKIENNASEVTPPDHRDRPRQRWNRARR
jgi:ABC-type glycerol-3-phosphate transport system substrate-binding protein